MTKLTVSNILLGKPKIFSIKKEIRATGTEDISTKSTMMSSSNKRNELFGAMLTFGLLLIFNPFLFRT